MWLCSWNALTRETALLMRAILITWDQNVSVLKNLWAKHVKFHWCVTWVSHVKTAENVNYSTRTIHLIRIVLFEKAFLIFYDKEKHFKTFECICINGFTGDFCQHKQESDYLLFLIDTKAEIYNVTENNNPQIVHDLRMNFPIYQSCSTMLNGLSLVFGGSHAPRQVFLTNDRKILNALCYEFFQK